MYKIIEEFNYLLRKGDVTRMACDECPCVRVIALYCVSRDYVRDCYTSQSATERARIKTFSTLLYSLPRVLI